MVEINIPPDQQRALADIDIDELDKLTALAIREERAGALNRLRLDACGPYIAGRFRAFERALSDYRQSKSSRKRAETEDAVRRAAFDLSFAASAMKSRMETELEERQLFFVDEQIITPLHFSRHLEVIVGFRWRKSTHDAWSYGHMKVSYEVKAKPAYDTPRGTRKSTSAKRSDQLQNELYDTWEHLKRGALFAVRDYFRAGGDGASIPTSVKARPDAQSGLLNNYSTAFWRDQGDAS